MEIFELLKVAIFGGSFDPIHIGHLQVARNALDFFPIEQVFFVPCAASPHKVDSVQLEGTHRLAMVQAAISRESRFQALSIEIEREGPSYSVETLRQLRKIQSSNEFFFILGSDNFQNINQWRDFSELARLCDFLVVERPGFSLVQSSMAIPKELQTILHYHILRGPTIPVSSSEIRLLLKQGDKVKHLLPSAVYEYIQHHRLYRSS